MGFVVVEFPRALVVLLFDAVVVNNVELFDTVVNVGWVDGLKIVVVGRVELFDVVAVVVGWVEGLKDVVVGRVELFDVIVLQRRQTFFAFETI